MYYRLATTLLRRQRLEYGGKRDFSIGSECLLWAKSKNDSRHSTVSIYTTEGVKECYNFNGNSSVCKSTHYHNIIEDKCNVRYFGDKEKKDNFIISSCTGFTTKYLRRVTCQISIGATSFGKNSDMYNLEHNLYKSNAILLKLSRTLE